MPLTIPADLLQLAQSLYSRGFSDAEVAAQLLQKGTPENLLQEIIARVKKMRAERKSNNGFTYCAIGVTLLVLGFLLTFAFMGNATQMRIVMYGLTIIGAAITLKGLVDVLGW